MTLSLDDSYTAGDPIQPPLKAFFFLLPQRSGLLCGRRWGTLLNIYFTVTLMVNGSVVVAPPLVASVPMMLTL